jgi:hypothetical protein
LGFKPGFREGRHGEIFARRIGIEMEKDGLDIPFSDIVVQKLVDLFPPYREAYFQPIWSASLSA